MSIDVRKKIYYPDDQIVKNLFTNGGEFSILDDFSEYVGFYHRYTTGEVFTEPEWNPLKSRRLIRYRKLQEQQKRYYDIKLFNKSYVNRPNVKRKKSNNTDEYFRYSAPRPAKRQLTQKEIDEGKTYRYFVTKRNERERVFFEISTIQAQDYYRRGEGINEFLYELITIPWKVDGPEYDIYENGILKMSGVIDSNLRIVDRYADTFRLLKQIVRNPRELTVYENVPSVKPNVSVFTEPVSTMQNNVVSELPTFLDEDLIEEKELVASKNPFDLISTDNFDIDNEQLVIFEESDINVVLPEPQIYVDRSVPVQPPEIK
jgi:hypothetical protein